MNLAQISSSIIIIVTIAILNSEELNISNYIHFPYYVIPVHYCTQLDYITIYQHNDKLDNIWKEIFHSKNDYDSLLFRGETSTTINILQSTHYISLHKIKLIISPMNATLITKNSIIYILNKYKYTYKTNVLGFPLLYALLPGLYTFKIQFFGYLIENHKDSFFKNVSTENTITLLIAPHIQERNGMRQLFPCWDKPQLKATFNISIKHPRYISVLSNMPIRSQKHYDSYSDSLRTYFHITPPMSIFQIAIVMTEYQSIRINENITLWCEYCSKEQSPKFEFAQRIINNITLHLKSEFDEINIPKMDHIAIPNFPQDSISKWGLIFHTEANLIYNETLDTVMRKMEIAYLIAPKIAYQWFSNLLNSVWFHYWLHDGFAIMFGEEAVAKSFNSSEILDFFIIQNQYESLHLDSHFNMNPVEITSLLDINSIFSFPYYMKAIIILRMFQSAITDEVFRNNIHIYISRQMFSSIISYNFWSMKEELDEAYHCDLSANEFLTWIQYKHYPVVIWEQYKHSQVTKILSQSNSTTNNRKWLIPIVLREISSVNENLKACLTPRINSIKYPTTFPLNECWIVNIQKAGYYRVRYDSTTWDNITKYLNDTAGDYKSISVINRAKIVDDAFHLMMNRQLEVSLFWNLTKFLSQETNFVVWYPMIKVFEYMSITIPLSKEEIKFTDIMEKFRKLLEKPLKTLGYEEQLMENDFTKCLRQEIAKWACILQYDECEQSALRKLQQHLGNPAINPLLPWWKHWTYCNGLSIAYSFTWSHLKDIWFKGRNYTLLPFLTCFKYGSDAGSLLFLELFKQNERQDIKNMRSYIDIFHSIIMKHSNTYDVLEKILTFLEMIKPKQINILTGLVDIINHVYSYKNLMKVQDYIKEISYINKSQFLKIESKIARRLSEIVAHTGHFRFMNIH